MIEETNIYQLGWAPSKICQKGLGGEIIWFGQLQMFCYSRQEDRSKQAKMNLFLSGTQTSSLFRYHLIVVGAVLPKHFLNGILLLLRKCGDGLQSLSSL